jgi:uncharacterized protein (TIGR02996 family)
MRTFQFGDEQSLRFWNIDREGNRLTIRHGKATGGVRTLVKEFSDEATAHKELARLVREKLAKGYVETTPAPPPPVQQGLEDALVSSPDDLAAHMAYADWLNEQGDPRGELIQTQLALEKLPRNDPTRPALQQRAQQLIRRHSLAWLGELAPFLLGKRTELGTPFTIARGWLDYLDVDSLNLEYARTIARAPQVRLLRSMVIHQIAAERHNTEGSHDVPAGVYRPGLFPLLSAPNLGNLRRLSLERGTLLDGDELRTLFHSTSLPRLTTLQFRSFQSRCGDEVCRWIVESGILRQLKVLEMQFVGLTDEAACTLAACPDLLHLERLNLENNRLTYNGVSRLQGTGITLLEAERQFREDLVDGDRDEEDDDESYDEDWE